MSMDLFNSSGAVISDCGKYRYQLWRVWDEHLPKVMFIMLNPSTADASEDDPTIRRCIGFSKSWGFGGIMVGNLFAYRATNPNDLKVVKDPEGAENLSNLKKMSERCEIIVCAWGNKQGEPDSRLKKLGNLYYLDRSVDGTPKHPLYLKKDLKPLHFADDNLWFIPNC